MNLARRWPWLLGLPAIALAISFAVSCARPGESSAAKSSKGAAPGEVPVVGMAARTGDLGVYQTGLGTVTALATVTIRSRVDGQLINVSYREGQIVHQGDVLAQIDSRPFQVQLLQAEGQMAKDQAALTNARLDLQRYEVLSAEGAISRQQVDTQTAAVNQGEAAIKSDQAQIESASLNLTYSRITAPISGRVGLRLVDPGNMVHASDANGLLVIAQLQPMGVLFTIAADQLPPVLKQMRGGRRLAVEAWDRDLKNKLATGALEAVDNQVDPGTGTVRLKAVFGNEDSVLFPNQFVNARLLVDTLRETVIVPTAALQQSPQSPFVWVVRPDSTVEMRNVDVQLTQGDATSIRRGVSSGEVVVLDGVDKLQPGTKVGVAAPGAPAAGAKHPPAEANTPRKKSS